MENRSTKIPFNYVTVKTTKSRIDKGLLAIPVSFIKLFPKDDNEICLVDENDNEDDKKFTPYTSSSRECRIGGMRYFYEKYNIQSGDELVIEVLERGRFRILPEKLFEQKIIGLELKIDSASNNKEADTAIKKLAEFVNKKPEDILKNEFIRLANQKPAERKVETRQNIKMRSEVPPSLRKILLSLYNARCQISGFTFLMKTGEPYFEIHHINPLQGNHIKNLLVVSPNIHAQFTYAKLEQFFDCNGWLRKVKFNDETHNVFQIIDKLSPVYKKEVYSI